MQRALEDRRDVSRGNLMAEQLLRVAQQVARLLVHGELDPEALRRQRRHPLTVAVTVLHDGQRRGLRETGRLDGK